MADRARLQIVNVVGFVVMILANYAANAIPLNNLTTAEISDLYPNLLTPAGLTFAIWLPIYLLLLGFTVYQVRGLFSSTRQDMPFIQTIGCLFFVSSILNAGWIFAWHYLQIGLSMILMIGLLLALIRIYLKLGIGKRRVSASEALFVHLPFRIYLGWITIATIANATALLVVRGWGGFGLPDALWTIVVIVAATLITLAFLKLRRDLAVSLVSLWALFGIVVERISTEPVVWSVAVSAVAAMLIIAAFAAPILARRGARSA